MTRVRVLGIDPGLTRCGVAVVDQDARRRLNLVDFSVLRSSVELPLEQRLLTIEHGIQEWLDRYPPDVVALEQVFSQHNVQTVMATAQVSGVVLTAAARGGWSVTQHTPSEIKAAVTGSGRADKKQVASMVMRALRLSEPPRPADAADAVALAICHQWRGAAQVRWDAARQEAGARRIAAGGRR